jgi:hypothetical protein
LTKFIDIIPGSAVDKVEVQPDPVFNVKGINVHQVTERNTPSTINAVFIATAKAVKSLCFAQLPLHPSDS